MLDPPLHSHLWPLKVFRDSGKATINSTFGTRVAVLAGDYLFAQVGYRVPGVG